jgi:cobalamin biosynthesis protein CobW
VARARGGDLAPEVLLGLVAASEEDMAGRESHHDLEGDEHDHDDFASFVVSPRTAASVEDICGHVRAALALPGVLRVKGRAAVDGKAGTAVVQGVGARVETYFSSRQGDAATCGHRTPRDGPDID